MKKIFLSLALTAGTTISMAQNAAQNEKEIDALLNNGKYEELVQRFSGNQQQLNALGLFGVGFAYHALGKPSDALKWVDAALAKDPKLPKAHFVRGYSLQTMQLFPEAETSFKKALELDPEDADAMLALGDSYTAQEKFKEALETYTKASQLPNPPPEAFVMIAQAYNDMGDTRKALEAFYQARLHIKSDGDLRNNVATAIGQLELNAGRPEKALPIFLEIQQSRPGSLDVHPKIIQCYYAQKAYDKAVPYIKNMYEAQKKGLLEGNANEEFCIHQFTWKDKRIFVYERYQEPPSSKIFNKHIFYVMNEKMELEWQLQTEYSPIARELGSEPYILCGWEGKTHLNFGNMFPAGYNFDDVKAAVVRVMEKRK